METLKIKRKIMIGNIRFPEWLSTDDKEIVLSGIPRNVQ